MVSVCNDLSAFTSIDLSRSVALSTVGSQIQRVSGVGSVKLFVPSGGFGAGTQITLHDVYWVPESPYCLVSGSRLEDAGLYGDLGARVIQTRLKEHVCTLTKTMTGYMLYMAVCLETLSPEDLSQLGTAYTTAPAVPPRAS